MAAAAPETDPSAAAAAAAQEARPQEAAVATVREIQLSAAAEDAQPQPAETLASEAQPSAEAGLGFRLAGPAAADASISSRR